MGCNLVDGVMNGLGNALFAPSDEASKRQSKRHPHYLQAYLVGPSTLRPPQHTQWLTLRHRPTDEIQ